MKIGKKEVKIKSCVAVKDGSLTRDFIFNSVNSKDFTITVPFKESEKHFYYIHPNGGTYVVMKDRTKEKNPYCYPVPDELWLSEEVFKEYFKNI